jgi:hypothetical protein
MKSKKGLKIIAIPIFIALGIAVLSFVVMKLWNFSLVKAANLNEINYWQAMALLVLSKILFGFGMGGQRKGHRKWSKRGRPLTGDQKEAFKHKWKEYCKPSSDEDRNA